MIMIRSLAGQVHIVSSCLKGFLFVPITNQSFLWSWRGPICFYDKIFFNISKFSIKYFKKNLGELLSFQFIIIRLYEIVAPTYAIFLWNLDCKYRWIFSSTKRHHISDNLAEVGRFLANAKNAFNSLIGRILALNCESGQKKPVLHIKLDRSFI